MARAVIKASALENGDYSTRPVKMAPPRMGIIEAYKEGAASLTVTLLRPLVRAGEMPETVPQGEKQLSFVIDKPIHRGENPVVPGLCMIEHLWRALNKPLPLNWDVKFKMPAFAGEQIDIYKNGASLDGYCGGRELFTVGIKES